MKIQDTGGQDTQVEKNRSLSKVVTILLALIVVAGSLALLANKYWYLISADKVLKSSNLRFTTAKRGDLTREIVAQGRIVAANSPTLFSGEPGFVRLRVKAGDSVAKGQVLASISSPELNEALAQESSTFERLQVELQRQKIHAKRRRTELQQVADLARVELKASERELRRAVAAKKFELISQIDFEQAEDSLARARLRQQQALQNKSLENEIMDFEIETLKLGVKSQALVVESLQRRVAQLEIHSPAGGVVGNTLVEEGQAVSDNQALISVVDLSAYEVEATVAESYSDELLPMLETVVRLNGDHYPATLVAISPEVINAQVSVRIRFDSASPKKLRQNQRVSVKILLENKKDVLLIERGAIVDNFDGYLFLHEEPYLRRASVVLGAKSLSHIEISRGAEEGDTFVNSPLDIDRSVKTIFITH